MLYQVNKQMDASVDMQSYEPVGLFLNGKYWGLYNLMERKGQNFIKNNHNEDDVHILTGESVNIVRGSSVDYEKLLGLVFGNNINDSVVYNKVCDMMDIASYIDYWVFETYCGAHDISVNIRFWKPKRENTKWRWISYDQDSWSDYDDESLDYYLSNGKVSLLERLMRNETFQHQFINRVCDFLNTGFKAENVIEKVKSITTRIHDEDLKDRARWQDTMLYVPQNQRVDSLIEYAKKRPIFLRENMISFFEIEGKVQKISINSDEQRGSVKINQIIANGNWEGDYLGGIPLKITAIPNDDYEFVRWKNRKLGKNSTVIIDPSNIQEVIPIFEKRSFVHNK
ncbi:MAG: CotH kinase family protein [Bacteroidota bacterium]|nr:CotH kinase family protein [Bacteroidota bacterium]